MFACINQYHPLNSCLSQQQAFLPKKTETPSIKLGELPSDIQGHIIGYQSRATVYEISKTGRSVRDATMPIISTLEVYIKICRRLINKNAQNIKDIEVGSVLNIEDYFFLAKQAVTPNSSDKYEQRP